MALVVVDAGVLIGVLDRSDSHHEAAMTTMRGLLDHGQTLVAPATVYAEVLVGPLRRDEASGARVEAFFDDLAIHVEPTSRAIARLAAVLRAVHGSRMRLPDAIVVATAQALGALRVVTTDARWPSRMPVDVEII